MNRVCVITVCRLSSKQRCHCVPCIYYQNDKQYFINGMFSYYRYYNLYVLVTKVFSVSKLSLWYLYMSSIDLATRFRIGMSLLNMEKRYERFSEINIYNTSFKLTVNR